MWKSERNWETSVDRAIREAMERGEFANLPGEGKPMELYEDAFTPDDLQLAYGILKDNDLAPDWIVAGKELTAKTEGWQKSLSRTFANYQTALKDPQRHMEADAAWKRAQDKLRENLARLNSEITSYNLKVPPGIQHRGLLSFEREIEQLRKSN